jgi:hypothetical protein
MSNYLKKLLFSALILTMPYMNSASKAMDDGDYEGSSVRIHKVSLMTEDQKNVSSSIKQSTSSQVVSSEDSQMSWASYMISPVKATFQIANEFINLATHNPKLAMAVGFTYTLQAAAALDCACYCISSINGGSWQFCPAEGYKLYSTRLGNASSLVDCMTACDRLKFKFCSCNS